MYYVTARGDELIASFEASYSALILAYNNIGASPSKDQTDLFYAAKDAYTKTSSAEGDLRTKFKNAQATYDAILAGKFFTAVAGPFKIVQDTNISISIQPKPSGDAINLTQSVRINATGSKRLTYSIGPIFSVFKNRTFFKDSSGKAQQNSSDDFQTDFGAFVHAPVFGNSDPNFSVALSLGIALHNNNPALFFGPSFIFGRQQRAIFSAGIAAVQVNTLSGGLKIGDTVTGAQPTTSDVYRPEGFFAFTFNLQ